MRPDTVAERPPPGIVRGPRDPARLSQPGHSLSRQGTNLGRMTPVSDFPSVPESGNHNDSLVAPWLA